MKGIIKKKKQPLKVQIGEWEEAMKSCYCLPNIYALTTLYKQLLCHREEITGLFPQVFVYTVFPNRC